MTKPAVQHKTRFSPNSLTAKRLAALPAWTGNLFAAWMTTVSWLLTPLSKSWRQSCEGVGLSLLALTPVLSGIRAAENADSSMVAYVQTAQFKIPFSVEARGAEPLKVQLWVSADDGTTWQTYGNVAADAKSFDFRAAAEGTYLFKVATIDATGTTYPNLGVPLKVLVDTTKPRAEIQADVDGTGRLVVDIKVYDEHLDPGTAVLRLRSDQAPEWRDLPLELREGSSYLYSGQVVADLAPCREVAVVLAVKDRSLNEGEATCEYTMPRTASGNRDVTLASSKNSKGSVDGTGVKIGPPSQAPRLTSTPNATQWTPTKPAVGATIPHNKAASETKDVASQVGLSPGRLASESGLSLDPPVDQTEEIPLPPALTNELGIDLQAQPLVVGGSNEVPQSAGSKQGSGPHASSALELPAAERPTQTDVTSSQPTAARDASTIGRAFHCKSRAFSLDYSVEALGGSALADVELWGTEDGGREWQKWGSDPDRVSPFDVQVGNDGLFGFRMVIVGTNGIVSNRPREGDAADVWINVDTNLPLVKITRAVYGEGPEDGMLVIDYSCQDGHLVDRPIVLSYSERLDGPWTEIATGLANTGLYLWKAAANLPDKIYLKIECVDKAGNIGSHRLDLPIDIRGLAPRGIIQGFRPIEVPSE